MNTKKHGIGHTQQAFTFVYVCSLSNTRRQLEGTVVEEKLVVLKYQPFRIKSLYTDLNLIGQQ